MNKFLSLKGFMYVMRGEIPRVIRNPTPLPILSYVYMSVYVCVYM